MKSTYLSLRGRRRSAQRRALDKQSRLLRTFIQHLMQSGKRKVALGLVAKTLKLFYSKLSSTLKAPPTPSPGVKTAHTGATTDAVKVVSQMQRKVNKGLPRLWLQKNPAGVSSLKPEEIYSAFHVRNRPGETPGDLFEKAIENVVPSVEVRSQRVGGAVYQVPRAVPRERGEALAIRWVLQATKRSSNKKFVDKLASELVQAFNRTGYAIQKKEEIHRLARRNKVFSKWRKRM